MLAAARRARRRRLRRRHHQPALRRPRLPAPAGWSRVVEGSERTIGATAEDYKWLLLALAGIFALVGIFLGYLVYDRRRIRAVEPAFLANGWYYDQTSAAFVGGPGRGGVRRRRRRSTPRSSTARSTARARASAPSAQRLRRSETGYVRNYALGIGVGAVLLLGWFVARGLMSMNGFPILTAIIVLPGRRRPRRRAAAQVRGRSSLRPVGRRHHGRRAGAHRLPAGQLRDRRRRLPVRRSTPGSRSGGSPGTSASTASRCSWWC